MAEDTELQLLHELKKEMDRIFVDCEAIHTELCEDLIEELITRAGVRLWNG
jgi:hypothetical protein